MASKAREPRISISFMHPASDKHWGGIESVCLLPFGSTLFTGSRDTFIKRWGPSADNGGGLHCQASLDGHSGWVTALAYMHLQPRGLLISGSYDTTIKLWDPLSRGKALHTFQEHSDYVLQLATAQNVGKFVSAGLRGDLHIWDVEACCRLVTAGAAAAERAVVGGGRATAGSIYSMHCTPDLQVIAFTGADGSICMYDPRSDHEIGSLKGHADNVKALRVSADGHRIVSGSSDRTVRVWDVGQRACTAALEMHSDSVWALDGDDDLGNVISGGRDARVFLTDVAREKTELIAEAGASVLDVQVDWKAQRVWVGTTLPNLTAWSIADIDEPAQPVFAHPLQPPDSGGRLSATRVQLPAYEPRAAVPIVDLQGIAPLVRHAVFEDKRHILTLDANSVVALWDVVYCANVRVFEGHVDFEAKYKELFLQMLDPVPAWFTSDVQLGVVTLHLANPQAFTSELYAQAIGMECRDDVKLNYGHEMLKAVLVVWKLKNAPPEPFNLMNSSTVRARVACRAQDTDMPWCQFMHRFTGHEHELGLLPKWVIDSVTKGAYVVPLNDAKLSFKLRPALTSRLPRMERDRLTAPVILEMHKVVHYVRDKLREQDVEVDIAEVTWNQAENEETWRQARGPLLQITCNGKLVPFNMTLNTVKRYLCTGRTQDDIPLEYGLVDLANPAPLPKITPVQISNH